MGSRIASIAFLSGIACIFAGVALGEGKVGIFIIFPFIYGSGWLMLAGMILIFISFPVFMLSQFRATWKTYGKYDYGTDVEYGDARTRKRAGGLILIGPVPIVISSDRRLSLILMAVGMIFALIFFIMFFFSRL